jgi:hypothetical protein
MVEKRTAIFVAQSRTFMPGRHIQVNFPFCIASAVITLLVSFCYPKHEGTQKLTRSVMTAEAMQNGKFT